MRTDVRVLAALAAVILGTAGCFVGADPEADEPGGAGEPGASAPPAGERRAEQPTTEEFEADIRSAADSAQRYWAGRFEKSGVRFTPIRQIGAYREEGEVNCGGEPIPRNNAVYCPAGDFIAYDVEWAVTAFARVGDAFLYYLLGHEYAHGIQVRLGIQYSYTIQQELQADCMAGAYIGDSAESGLLIVEDGDIDELRDGLLAVGDDPSVPWFKPGAHGTAEERTASFFDGYERSLAACKLPS
jgi:predicted metalloprotease